MYPWGGDRGSKEMVLGITTRPEPSGRSPPATYTYSTMRWTILVERYVEFEAHVLTTRRRYLHDPGSEEEGPGIFG